MNEKIEVSFDIPERHIKKRLAQKGIIRENLDYWEECFRESLGFFLYRKKSFIKKRTQTLVRESYERIFSLTNEEWARQMTQANSRLVYKNESWIANGWLLKNVIVQMLDSCFNQLGCRNILEVGSGRGDNIVSLSLKNPGLDLTGLELAESGLRRSIELANNPQFATNTVDFIKSTVGLDSGKVSFAKGDALGMPFTDNSFDTAFTTLVLEQIPYDYPKVLQEMRRVTSRYAIFIESFSETNNLRSWLHLKKFDYFNFSYSKLKGFGFRPIIFFTDYPQKVNQGSGLLVTEIIK